MTKLLQPIWFRLPKKFYERLNTVAGSVGMEPEDALELALDLLTKFVVTAKHNKTGPKEFIARIWALLRSQQKSADAHQINLMAALEDAVKLYRIYGPITDPVPSHGDVTPARSAPSALGILYWAKIPPEERTRRARELARKRWDAKKSIRPKAVGDDTERESCMGSLDRELYRIQSLRLWEDRLQASDSVFARLVFLSQLRDASGRYTDRFLVRTFSARSCHQIVADAHLQVFREWIALEARAKLRDFQKFCDSICQKMAPREAEWASLCRDLVPSGISIDELDLFRVTANRFANVICRRKREGPSRGTLLIETSGQEV